jgi:hypothetical protein
LDNPDRGNHQQHQKEHQAVTNAALNIEPQPLSWVEQANKEIAELQEAAKADPKAFYGNRQRGMGEGLARVTALLRATKGMTQALNGLDRGM